MSFSFFLVCNICLYFDLPVHQDGPSDLVQAALLTPAPDFENDDDQDCYYYQYYHCYAGDDDGDDYLLRVLLQIFRHQFLSGEGLVRNMFVRHLENAVGEANQMEMAYLGLSYWQLVNCNAAAIFGK